MPIDSFSTQKPTQKREKEVRGEKPYEGDYAEERRWRLASSRELKKQKIRSSVEEGKGEGDALIYKG